MTKPRLRRAIVTVAMMAGATLTGGAFAFACVPQQGGIQVENIEIGGDHEGSRPYTDGTSGGFIVGDGDGDDDTGGHR